MLVVGLSLFYRYPYNMDILILQMELAPRTRSRPASLDSQAPRPQGSCVVEDAALVELVRRRVQAGHKNRAWSAKAEVARVGGGGGSKLRVEAMITFTPVCLSLTPFRRKFL